MRAKSLLIILVILLSPLSSRANELRGIIRNNKGVEEFGQEKPVEALDRFSEALADIPFSGAIHYNLGTTFLINKEFNKALSEFKSGLEQSRGNSEFENEVRFRTFFNSAVTLTEMKKIDEALSTYQAALAIKPDSKETKHNIELLTQMAQGGGEGEEEQEQDQGKGDQKKDQQGQGNDQKEQQQQQKPNPTPKPFKSEQLSQQDVNKILEELKRQEEQIRARMQEQGAKDAPTGKDW